MAKTVGACICMLIVVLDVIAGIRGLEAEIEHNKVCHFIPKQKTSYFIKVFMFQAT